MSSAVHCVLGGCGMHDSVGSCDNGYHLGFMEEDLEMLCNLPKVSTKDVVQVGILPHRISPVHARMCMCARMRVSVRVRLIGQKSRSLDFTATESPASGWKDG